VQSNLGPVGEAGLYLLFLRHGALEASLRYAHLRYSGVDARSFDGSGIAFLWSLHIEI
jgi:hypothetical protein